MERLVNRETGEQRDWEMERRLNRETGEWRDW